MADFAGLPVVEPETVGFASSRLARIDATMAAAIEAGRAPGTITVVARRGNVVHTGVHGYLDSERRNPLPIDALFRMYSQTKPVVAALTMQLQEEGLFFLDHPITNWLPESRAGRCWRRSASSRTSARCWRWARPGRWNARSRSAT